YVISASLSIPPMVQDVKSTGEGVASACAGGLKVGNCFHDFGLAHVPRQVVVLVDGENPSVGLVGLVQLQEIAGVLGDDRQTMGRGESEVHVVILALQTDVCIRRSDDLMTCLPEKVSQKIGVGAVIEIQVEGHPKRLRA